jgi:hypothetical protein
MADSPASRSRTKAVSHRTVITYHQMLLSPDDPLIVELDREHRVQVLAAAEYGPDILYKYVVISDA